MKLKLTLRILFLLFCPLLAKTASAAEAYRINPGDILDIAVWNEQAMDRRVIVLPDGVLSYPLAGHVTAAGLTPNEIERELAKRLEKYFPAPTVTVAVSSPAGNVVYVLGEVQAPGQYPVGQQIDVLKALSLARGLTEFADRGSIKVIRRQADGSQEAIPFNFGAVQGGRDLSSNILLKPSDVVVVPTKGLF